MASVQIAKARISRVQENMYSLFYFILLYLILFYFTHLFIYLFILLLLYFFVNATSADNNHKEVTYPAQKLFRKD